MTPEEQAAADAAAATTAAADAAAQAAAAAAAAATNNGGTNDGTPPAQTPEEKAAADAAAAAAAAATGAPEKYSLTVPEGGLLSTSDLKALEAQARKANLTNEDAQAWINEQAVLLAEQSSTYHAETLADPEYGGDKLAESQALVNRVINRFRPDGHARRAAFMEFIARAGANNALPVVAFLADIGKAMGEDTVTGGRTSSGGSTRKTDADVLFGDAVTK